MTETKVSVVIPTLNSAKTLEKLRTPIRTNKNCYEYEVIVAGAESCDEIASSRPITADWRHR